MELSPDYFVRFATGAESGPYTADELRELVRGNRLKPSDFVRRGEYGTWVVAARSRGFEFSDSKKAAAEVAEAPPVSDALSGSEAASADTPAIDAAEPPPPPAVALIDDGTTESGYILSLALRGYSVRTLPGESVCYTLEQDFLDAFRVSMCAALLGKRGALVVTTRRAMLVSAALTQRQLDVVYLSQLDRVSFATRLSVARCVIGGVCALGGVTSLILAQSGLLGALGLMMPLGSTIATIYAAALLAFGAVMLALSRGRVLELAVASGSLRFAKRHADFEAIHRIDEAVAQTRA